MPAKAAPPFTPKADRPGPCSGTDNDHTMALAYAEVPSDIMAARLDRIPRRYDRACQLDLPGGITAHGWGDADRFWTGLRAAFPSATFAIQYRIGRDDPAMPSA